MRGFRRGGVRRFVLFGESGGGADFGDEHGERVEDRAGGSGESIFSGHEEGWRQSELGKVTLQRVEERADANASWSDVLPVRERRVLYNSKLVELKRDTCVHKPILRVTNLSINAIYYDYAILSVYIFLQRSIRLFSSDRYKNHPFREGSETAASRAGATLVSNIRVRFLLLLLLLLL